MDSFFLFIELEVLCVHCAQVYALLTRGVPQGSIHGPNLFSLWGALSARLSFIIPLLMTLCFMWL